MMKHEQQTSWREKSSNFFGGNNFSGLNLYKKCINLIGLLFLFNMSGNILLLRKKISCISDGIFYRLFLKNPIMCSVRF